MRDIESFIIIADYDHGDMELGRVVSPPWAVRDEPEPETIRVLGEFIRIHGKSPWFKGLLDQHGIPASCAQKNPAR